MGVGAQRCSEPRWGWLPPPLHTWQVDVNPEEGSGLCAAWGGGVLISEPFSAPPAPLLPNPNPLL